MKIVDVAETFTIPTFCQSCRQDQVAELVHVTLGLVEWSFLTCMTCGKTTREVQEFDVRGSLV